MPPIYIQSILQVGPTEDFHFVYDPNSWDVFDFGSQEVWWQHLTCAAFFRNAEFMIFLILVIVWNSDTILTLCAWILCIESFGNENS